MNELLFLEYPKCSTCQKARNWLEKNGICFKSRHIVENRPNADELKAWNAQSDKPLKSFFNTSGLKYKALGLKDKWANLSEDELYAILASDGMLVKRPLLIGKNFVLIGFREQEWEERLTQMPK